MINRNSRNKLYWDLFVNTVMLFTYIRVPYNIAFGAPKCDAQLERVDQIANILQKAEFLTERMTH